MSWSMDPNHTQVTFSAKHLGVSTVRGHFTQIASDLDLDDPNDPTTGRGSVTIQTASVDTGNQMRDGHIKGADFFDVEQYPTITFTLKSIAKAGADYKVTADLTIKGVTKEITLDYEHNGTATDPYGNVKVGGTLTGSINRSDWGLAWNVPLGSGGLLVGEKVKLEIDGELGLDKVAKTEARVLVGATA